MEHLLVNVMGLNEDNNVMKALEHFMGVGQVDIFKLTEMTNNQIHNMKYKEDKGADYSPGDLQHAVLGTIQGKGPHVG